MYLPYCLRCLSACPSCHICSLLQLCHWRNQSCDRHQAVTDIIVICTLITDSHQLAAAVIQIMLPCHHHDSPSPEFQLHSRIFRNRFSALSSAFLRHSFLHAFLHLKNVLSNFLSFRDVEVIIFPFSEIVNRYFLIFSDFYSLYFLKIQEIKKETSFNIFSVSYTKSYQKMSLI